MSLTPPTPLSRSKIEAALQSLPNWAGNENGLDKLFVFEHFSGAMRFMQACVDGIELGKHHPVWTNKYNSVTVHLDTFDIGHKVTQKDVDLANLLESVLKERGTEFGYIDE